MFPVVNKSLFMKQFNGRCVCHVVVYLVGFSLQFWLIAKTGLSSPQVGTKELTLTYGPARLRQIVRATMCLGRQVQRQLGLIQVTKFPGSCFFPCSPLRRDILRRMWNHLLLRDKCGKEDARILMTHESF
jgi:hypothetical protein